MKQDHEQENWIKANSAGCHDSLAAAISVGAVPNPNQKNETGLPTLWSHAWPPLIKQIFRDFEGDDP